MVGVLEDAECAVKRILEDVLGKGVQEDTWCMRERKGNSGGFRVYGGGFWRV